MRFVTRTMHAYLDYPVALSLMTLPFVLGLGMSNPLARWLAVGTGVAALILTLFTDHELGVIRVLPYWFHLLVDISVALLFIAAPIVFGFEGLDALYYMANGAAVLVVCSLHKPEPNLQQAFRT
ncbi:MAG: hypothetical protein AB7S74_18895 [Hyphomicrobium sp.]